jgi:acetyl esterase/lipase
MKAPDQTCHYATLGAPRSCLLSCSKAVITLALLGASLSPTLRAADPTGSHKIPTALNEVQIIPDVPYYTGKDADPIKHRLDLYLPRGQKDFPVLFFVHGGAWRHGDKGYLGLYSMLGMFWARHGVGAVITNYRLTPTVMHPEHIKDVAKAFAWTYKNIDRYGGRADEIFVSGHSAGGHLVALLATDDSYLKTEGLSLRTIKGAIPMSGVYQVCERNRIFDAAFGTAPKVREDASPLFHVSAADPPFLIIYGDNDLAQCGKECSETFCRALRDHKCEATALEARDRNHLTILLMAATEDDLVARAILDFVYSHLSK